ncbi:hypothetical protein DSO57_1020815 [Entomophthora muscae]|uniref:Uncharacterized protein n=1 Tax=Entomophthora muscae TaxID=34485 RepID=A0ACC2U234_9FUNG|nr:hypothetical protein DSO57_1020815 [Entomophthora muscae]
MEGSSTALKAIQKRRHQTSVYPAGHADIHLGDVVLFNIGDTVREHRPQAFNDLYLGVFNHESLFDQQMVADLFTQIVFHVKMGNQSCKDKHLPPCATVTYQPIKAMTNEEYNKWHMMAITVNPPTSTPATPPSSPTHPIPELTGQHHLNAFLPTIFCLLSIFQDTKSTVELQQVREESKQILAWPTR